MSPRGASVLVDRRRIAEAYDALAEALNRDLPEGEILLLPVMNGGVFPVCELSRRLRSPMRFDYVHASRYRGATTGAEVQWLHWPDLSNHPSTVVLIDDIFDEGYTLKAIHDRLAGEDDGSRRVVTVALVRKMHDRGLPRDWIAYHGLDIPDRYVFGCGMDWHEHYRELPDLWAVDP